MNDEITALLQKWRSGDPTAEGSLMETVYPILRAFAHKQLADRKSLTLQPTELAHEAYFRLAGQRHVDWQNRGHFFAIAARLVRRVVIDYLRERAAEKRGNGECTVSIEHMKEAELPTVESDTDWLRFDMVLSELDAFDRDGARIVELRYFVGLTMEEVAMATGLSTATLGRQWRTARAWLHQRLKGQV